MICYKDMTFCSYLDCQDNSCHRRLTDKVKEDAKKWWGRSEAQISVYVEKPDCYKGE